MSMETIEAPPDTFLFVRRHDHGVTFPIRGRMFPIPGAPKRKPTLFAWHLFQTHFELFQQTHQVEVQKVRSRIVTPPLVFVPAPGLRGRGRACASACLIPALGIGGGFFFLSSGVIPVHHNFAWPAVKRKRNSDHGFFD